MTSPKLSGSYSVHRRVAGIYYWYTSMSYDFIFAASILNFVIYFAISCVQIQDVDKYGFDSCDPVDTPMVEKSKTGLRLRMDVVDPSLIVARPTEKHLNALCRWDHAGCQETRRQNIGQFTTLGDLEFLWMRSQLRSKHIDIRFYFIKEHVENGVIELYFVNMEYQLTDIFTKALGRERIEFLINKLDLIALDDAFVATANRIKSGKCNLRLSSDVTSKEATLQVVYDVLKLTPIYKAFQVTADVPEIYMQEFWVSAYMHNRSVRFKMDNKKHILNLDQFRDILQICPKVGNKKFEEHSLEKEISRISSQSGHSGDIKEDH
ncbi:hypothetical protein Tco_0090021 [Tanacetum coccineum]